MALWIISILNAALFLVSLLLWREAIQRGRANWKVYNKARELMSVDVGAGTIICQGVEFGVVAISTDGNGWQLQAEDVASLNRRLIADVKR